MTTSASHLQIGITPVIITNQMDWSDEADRTERAALLKEIEQWRSDWSSLNTEAYLAHYAHDFSTGSVDSARLRAAEAFGQFRQVMDQGQDVQRQHLPLSRASPNLVVVNFEQDYDSNNLSNRMNKRQYWMKQNGTGRSFMKEQPK